MQDATVVRWLKQEGDPISKDELVVTIESEKASQDVEALTDGVLYKIMAQAGEVVPVNTPLAIIRLPGDSTDDLLSCEKGQPISAISAEENRAAMPNAASKQGGAIKSSPLARKLAESRCIDLATIPCGSGPGGRIVEKDVLAFCESLVRNTPVADSALGVEPEDKRIPLSSIRQRAIHKLRQSRENTIPVTSVTEIDLTELLALYRQIKPAWRTAHQVEVTLNAFFVRAVALALREHGALNATLADNQIILKSRINICLAMHIEEELYVPVIKCADTLNVLAVGKVISAFVDKIRHKSLTVEDVTGGTFTITNVGPFDVLFSTPVIVYPQAAILGIGKIMERPVYVGEEIARRHLCYFALTYDHQVIDGVPAASFRLTLKQLLEHPMSLLSCQ